MATGSAGPAYEASAPVARSVKNLHPSSTSLSPLGRAGLLHDSKTTHVYCAKNNASPGLPKYDGHADQQASGTMLVDI